MASWVDANVHVIAADRQKYPVLHGGLPAWAADGSAEDLLAHMRQAGVHQAVLAQAGPEYGEDHSYCLDSASRHPESLVAVGIVNVAAAEPVAAFRSLVERGVAGVRFEYGALKDRIDASAWLDAPETLPLWQEAARQRISVGLPHVEMKHLAAVRRVLERFPTVPVVLRRMIDAPAEDGPPYRAAKDLLALGEFPNLYFTFHNGNIENAKRGKSTPEAFFETFLGQFGANHMMWATFYPSHQATPEAPYKGLVDQMQHDLAFLSQENREWMLGETARTVFPALRGAAQQTAEAPKRGDVRL